MIKGTEWYQAKKGSNGITSCFVAMRTNLFPFLTFLIMKSLPAVVNNLDLFLDNTGVIYSRGELVNP